MTEKDVFSSRSIQPDPWQALWAVATLTFLSPACSHVTLAPPVQARSIHSQVQELAENSRSEDCDRNLKSIAIELADAVDFYLRSSQIPALERNSSPSKDFRLFQLGPTFFSLDLFSAEPRVGWYEFKRSWNGLYWRYLKNLKNKNWIQGWAQFNQDVHTLYTDDRNRILGDVNLYLNKDSGPLISHSAERLTRCLADAHCGQPIFDSFELEMVHGNFYFNRLLHKIGSETSFTGRRALIKRLSQSLNVAKRRYEFQPNSTVYRKSENEIILPLRPGPFAAVQLQLATWIEGLWRRGSKKLTIQWVADSKDSKVSQLELSPEIGGRGSVSGDRTQIFIFPGGSIKSLAHEIGHVLGFRDHYFTVWHPEACEYVMQNNDEDLMSNSSTGSVTEEEWEELDRYYE